MLYNSAFFVFAFLPLSLLFYVLAGRRFRIALLFLISWIFYAWSDPTQLPILGLSLITNYVLAFWIGRRLETRRSAQFGTLLAVSANLLFLAFYKYGLFMIENLNSILEWSGRSIPVSVQLYFTNLSKSAPLGISFFTFQALSYVLDVSKKLYPPERKLGHFALYFSFFPKLISGPITRYRDFNRQINIDALNVTTTAEGMRRFFAGLFKKVWIAVPLSNLVADVFIAPANQMSAGYAWLGAMSFALQIYYDFSGYTDMAIGLGLMFGFRLPENFNYPYISESITDFWRRWHITLSNWFRDYLYFPLERKRNRTSQIGLYGNILIVFLLTGLWHGASWVYVCWGLIQGGFIALERTRFGDWMRKFPRPLRHIYAGLIILLSWVVFRSPSLDYALHYFKAMLGLNGTKGLYYPEMLVDNQILLAMIIGGIFMFPVFPKLRSRILDQSTPTLFRPIVWDILSNGIILILFVLALVQLAGSTADSFIYFRF